MSVGSFLIKTFPVLTVILCMVLLLIFTTKKTKEKLGLYISVIVLSFIVCILEYIEHSLESLTTFSKARLVLSVLIYIIRPIEICLIIGMTVPKFSKWNALLLIPILANTIIYLCAFGTEAVFYFDEYNVFHRGPLGFTVQVVSALYFIALTAWSIHLYKQNKKSEGCLLLFCGVCCLLAVLIQTGASDYGQINFAVTTSGLALYLFYLVKRTNKDSARQELKVQEQRTALTISQIQPHFLYNVLGTIGYLCKKDPKVASKAIDEFADYLRCNLNSISQKNNVPFMNELKHVEAYLWLEQLRFEERLNVVYDINYKDFVLPSLSIQPLVENAVKHGICEKPEGGTIYIRTIKYDTVVKIIVEDNGIGFDESAFSDTSRTHVGIENVRARLQDMCNGTLEIRSTKGKGTIATITIPRS